MSAPNGNEIAIVGMAGRFPGAGSVAELWRNVAAGVESITPLSDEQLRAAGVDPALLADPHYVRMAARLDGIDLFDAAFFGFTPREAESMDPQHRLLLECAWEALEDAGCDPETFRGPIGLFAGSGFCRYLLHNLFTNPDLCRGLGDLQLAAGNERDALPTMVSYKLNLRGPSLAVQTFCSTSLVAVHLAAQSLLNFECDVALAGGVAIDLPQEKGYLYVPGGILSPDGRCRTFDAQAAGSILGNGVALVALKRLEDALADGDTVRAVIKGSAVNNDGLRRVGYTAPGVDGQAAVVVEALASGGIDPATVSYVEAHGTATPLGDSVEIAALKKAFQPVRGRQVCALGSVKTNVGHLDRAAGVTGLIKTACALQNRLLPPSLGFATPNPDLGLDDSPFYVNTEALPWVPAGGPLRAGVSSFGMGGTNAHVVLEEAPAPPPAAPARPWQLLVLSARSAPALEESTARLAAFLRGADAPQLPDVAWTLQTGRAGFNHRRMLVAAGPEDAAEALERAAPRRVFSSHEERRDRLVTFLFPGLGDHYPGMARGLYDGEPLFREQVDLCCELLRPELGLDLREVLWPADRPAPGGEGPEVDLRRLLGRSREPETPDPAAERLRQTWLAQPALFVVELALARLWMSWGIEPESMIGYSLGEYVAACLAGVFALEDALRLVARRARLIQELPEGAMLGVPLSEEEARPWLSFGSGPGLSLAAVNGPAFSVVAGPVEAVDDLERRLVAAEIACRRLSTTHAFHSTMMEPVAARFGELVAATRREPPRRAWISNLTGGWIRSEEATDPAYWVRHLCETVRFGDGLAVLAAEPGRVLLEIGPGQSLGSIARQEGGRLTGAVVLPTLRSAFERQEDVPYLLNALGRLWLAGGRPDWAGVERGAPRRRVPLPTYPFQRRRFWVEPGEGGPFPAAASAGKRPDPADWFYLPVWKPAPRPAPVETAEEETWLVFAPPGEGLAARLLERLRRGGARVVAVHPGGGFARIGPDDFAIDPGSVADHQRLLAAAGTPRRIVHLWSATEPAGEGAAIFDAEQAQGFGTLLALAQALGRAGCTDPLDLTVISSGVFRIHGAEALVPERATLAGPCRVIPQEYLNVRCRHIDVDLPAPGTWREERLADRLAAELAAPAGELTVAWRGDDRRVLDHAPVRLEGKPHRQPRLREGGVYLITGGLGGVGLLLAEHLARSWRARVALLGRTPLPPRATWTAITASGDPGGPVARRVGKLLELEAAGAEILVLAADVADAAALRAAVERVRERFGTLHGVIHAAGVADERSFRPIAEVTPEQPEEQLRPKARGAYALEEALRGEALDFVLLFSSVSTVLGGLGFYSYTAANAFLDAFAERRADESPVPWISVAWDSWPARDDQYAVMGATVAGFTMTREEGGEALERVLTGAAGPRLVHSTGDLQARIDQWVKLEGSRDAAGAPAARHERPELATRYVAPETAVRRALVEIWEDLLGIEPIGIHDDFFELGGHSLLATQMFSRVRAALAVDLPLRSLFEAPTIAALSELIAGAEEAAPEPVPRVGAIERPGELPLSSAQQRLWFLDRLEPGNPFYNICLTARLLGPLRPDLLRRGLGEIVRRHEVLRSTFREIDGRPVQQVGPAADPPLPVTDLRALPEGKREPEAFRLALRHHRRPFDLAAGPLLRCQVARLDGEEHLFFFTIHHIVADDWSFGVLVGELVALYEAFLAGRPAPLPELAVQYADFALWQREWLRSAEPERQLAYWREQLAGHPPVLPLPTDRPRPAVQTHRGATLFGSLSAERSADLRRLAQRRGVTLFMAMLAALDTLLFRSTGQEDIAVGAPIANRNRVEIEELIGFFVNTLVLRADLGGDPTFAQLLERVREVTLGAYANQDLPFEKLVEELRPERSLGHMPLFQVAFALQNAPLPSRTMGDLSVTALPVDSGTAKFELELLSDEREESLPLTFEYSTDLFDAATIERLIGHFQVLLAGIVADPDRRLSDLPLLTEAEQRQLAAWNETARDLPLDVCTHHLFEARVEAHPDRPAVSCGGQSLSYAELNRRANRWAWELIRRGVGPDVVVALLAERGIDFLVAVLAVFKAGGAYLPLDPVHPAPRLRGVLELAGSRLVLCGPGQAGRLEGGAEDGPALLSFAELEALGGAESDPPPRATPRDLAYVIFTSGSTGTPKGAMVEHAGMLNHLFAKIGDLELDDADTVAQNASQCFDISVWQLLAGLLVGGRVHIVEDAAAHDPRGLLEEVERGGVTLLETVPSLLRVLLGEALLAGATAPLARLRWMIPTGEALPPRLCRDWLAAFPEVPLLNAYGPTECSDDVAHHPLRVPPAADEVQVPIGRAVVNMRLHVLDRALRRAPVGVAGELWVAGTGVGRGYLNDPARTAEAFVPDPWSGTPGARLYRTGDLVRRRAGGEIEFLGRIDHQVKLRGFRIELGEIEAALAAHPGVAAAVVLVRADLPGGPQLAAFVAGGPERPGADELRTGLRDRLPDYMVPTAFAFLDVLPLTPNGKVDRRALSRLPVDAAAREARVPPRTAAERALAGLWADLLEIEPERIGAGDGFFALGGHSLLATRLVSRLRSELGVELPLRAVFEAPALEDLAARVDAAAGSGGSPAAVPPLRPVSRHRPLELSHAQQRLWFFCQLEPDSPLYDDFLHLRLAGELDGAALERALSEIRRRHEILRTTFPLVDGRPVQAIAPPSPFLLPVVDLAGLPEGEREAELQRVLRREALRPSDPAAGPLLRVTRFRLGPSEHGLLIGMHHILTDAWSQGILVRELSILYDAFRAGEPSPLPELPVQYADYAAWQRSWLEGPALQDQLAWWKEHLAGAPPVLELALDRPRPAVRSWRGASLSFELAADTAPLHACAEREGATLFMLLLAAFQALLGRWSGQTDVVVGSPIANRTRVELEGLAGFFVNTLALRTGLGGDPTVRELLGRVRATTLGAYAHQDLPFERLVEELRLERDLSHSPLFQVLLILQNAPPPEVRLAGLDVRTLELDLGMARFELTLTVVEEAGRLAATLSYSTDLFEAPTVARLAGHLRTLLAALAEAPERRIADLEILSAPERQQLLREWNDSAESAGEGLCLHELVEAQVRRTPEAPAVTFRGETLTYAGLEARANRLAHRLRALGCGPESLVAVALERSADLVVALLAVLRAGGAYVPLDPEYPADRLAFMLADARPAALVTTERLRETLPIPAGLPTICLDAEREALERESAVPPAVPGDGHRLAYVIYTSGSTGRPKGVGIPHAALVNFLRSMARRVPLGPGDTLLAVTTFSFDIAGLELYLPLLCGARVELLGREDAAAGESLREALARSGATVLQATPATWRLLLAAGWEGDSRLLALCGGEALPSDLADRLIERCGALWNLYGPTETTIWSAAQRLDRAGERVTLGRPLDNQHLLVLDRSDAPEPPGVPGELLIGGDGVARGYLGRPELTAERFVPDPYPPAGRAGGRLYRTGDMARTLPDGRLEFLGRVDHQVKVRGFRIELGEIESVLAACPGVRQAVVTVWRGTGELAGGDRLAAYVVPEPGAAPTAAVLRAALRERLPEPMLPAAWTFLEAFPRTPNGKIDRRALPAPAAGDGAAHDGSAEPGTALERLLAGLWRDLLGVRRVGRADNFFELGGDSIHGAILINRLQERLGCRVPVRALFQAPTLGGLAASIEGMERALEKSAWEIVPLPRAAVEGGDAGLPLSFAQQRIWFAERTHPGAYNSPSALRFEGRLDRAALERAASEVVRRHEVLRATFAELDGAPGQRIAAPWPVLLPLVDLTALPAAERRRTAEALISGEAERPFDLERGPLLRWLLVRLAPEEHAALLTLHHIVSDAWTGAVLVHEIGALYRAFAAGEPSPLPELPVQYADFAAWQRRWLESGALDAELAWWRETLRGPLTVLQLPIDRPRPARPSLRGSHLRRPLAPEIAAGLRELARRRGATFFAALLAGFQTLLFRRTRQVDILVGTAAAGRSRREIEGLIGAFVNMLVLRTDLSGDPTFLELLDRARDTAAGAFAHQDLPFDRLVEALRLSRDPAQSPLFQVAFGLDNAPERDLELPGLSLRPLELRSESVRFDLTLWMVEEEDGLAALWTYSTDLFHEATIARLHEQYEALLASVLATPEARLGELSLGAARHKHAADEEWGFVPGLRTRRRPVAVTEEVG